MKLSTLAIRRFLLLFCIATLFSCKDSDPAPEKSITDSDGLRIELDWTTGGTVDQSKLDVNLDLRLVVATTVLEESVSSNNFERVQFNSFYSDGDYKLNINVVSASKASNFKVLINGMASGGTEEVEGQTTTTDVGKTIEILTIRKAGTKYTIIQK